MMEVAFADLGRAVAADRDALDAAIARVLDSGRFVLGDAGRPFERELPPPWVPTEPRSASPRAPTRSSWRCARSAIGPGDEVVTQANTCVPTVAAIVRDRARRPVLCDADPETALMDPASLGAAVGPRTRAIVPVHLYGQCATWTRSSRAAPAACRGRGLRAGARARRSAAGRAGTLGDARRLQLLPDQEPRRARRRRRGDHRRRRRSPSGCGWLRSYGQADRYHHVERGRQQPPRRAPGGVPAREAPASCRARNERRRDDRAPRTTRRSRGTPARPLERPARARARLPPVRRPRAGPRALPGAARRARRRHARPLPRARPPLDRRTARSATARSRSRWPSASPRRSSACRSTPSSRTPRSSTSPARAADAPR